MKMHLLNILKQLEASEKEMKKAMAHFSNKIISFNNVRNFLEKMRRDTKMTM